jgi:hypothetical protein
MYGRWCVILGHVREQCSIERYSEAQDGDKARGTIALAVFECMTVGPGSDVEI